MLDVLMAAEHFCSIVAVSIPFLLFEILIIEKIRMSLFFFVTFPNSCLCFFLKFVETHSRCFFFIQRTEGYRFHEMISGVSTVTNRLSFGLKTRWKFYEFSQNDYWCLHAFNGCQGSGRRCIFWLCGCCYPQCLRRWLLFLVIVHWSYVQCV